MIEHIITIDNYEAYIVTPDSYTGTVKFPVVMAIHGSGRVARSYRNPSDDSLGIDFYQRQRDIVLNQNFIFCVITNNKTATGTVVRYEWGTDQGLSNLNSLYTYMVTNYNVETKWTLWATSAGGSLMHRFVHDYPARIQRCLATFPVYDLEDMYDRNTNCKTVWDTLGGKTAIGNKNPTSFVSSFINVPYLIYHGIDDTVVPITIHSEKFQNDVNTKNGHVILIQVSGGHATDNWAVYDDSVIIRFLNSTESACFYDKTIGIKANIYDITNDPAYALRVKTAHGIMAYKLINSSATDALKVNTPLGVKAIETTR